MLIFVSLLFPFSLPCTKEAKRIEMKKNKEKDTENPKKNTWKGNILKNTWKGNILFLTLLQFTHRTHTKRRDKNGPSLSD